MTLRPNLFQAILIGICLLLAAALTYANRTPYPSFPVNLDPQNIVSGYAKIYANGYWDEIEPEAGAKEKSTAATDSILLNTREAQNALVILLDGINYHTHAYARYSGTSYDNGIAMCHYPRFGLIFSDAAGRRQDVFSICFECRNVYISSYSKYFRSHQFSMTTEGYTALKALERSFFSE